MIDIENYIYTQVKSYVAQTLTGVESTTEYVETFKTLPAFTLMMTDNTTLKSTQDTSLTEHHATINFQLDAYAKTKAQVKQLANLLDLGMQNQKFTRIYYNYTPNRDKTIHRITLRYTGICSEDYQMYRRS